MPFTSKDSPSSGNFPVFGAQSSKAANVAKSGTLWDAGPGRRGRPALAQASERPARQFRTVPKMSKVIKSGAATFAGIASGGLKDKLKSKGLDQLPETVKPWVPVFGKHPEEMLAVEMRLLGELAQPPMDLSHITHSQQEGGLIPLFKAGIEVANRVFRILETAEKVVVIANRVFHFLVLPR